MPRFVLAWRPGSERWHDDNQPPQDAAAGGGGLIPAQLRRASTGPSDRPRIACLRTRHKGIALSSVSNLACH
jgi:hypothetical protein